MSSVIDDNADVRERAKSAAADINFDSEARKILSTRLNLGS